MLLVVDNGKADSVAMLARIKNKVVKPAEALGSMKNASAIILSDGSMKNRKENIEIVRGFGKPMLGIGAGSVFMAAAFGAKPVNARIPKNVMLSIEKPCPLLLDFRKVFSAVDECNVGINELPDNFNVAASSKEYEFQVIQDMERPYFGVHFDPSAGEGARVMANFARFVEIWERYHK